MAAYPDTDTGPLREKNAAKSSAGAGGSRDCRIHRHEITHQPQPTDSQLAHAGRSGPEEVLGISAERTRNRNAEVCSIVVEDDEDGEDCIVPRCDSKDPQMPQQRRCACKHQASSHLSMPLNSEPIACTANKQQSMITYDAWNNHGSMITQKPLLSNYMPCKWCSNFRGLFPTDYSLFRTTLSLSATHMHTP